MSSSTQKPQSSIDVPSHSSPQSVRRRNKKSRMSYITPPLTPASSIKTAGSVDTEDECDAGKKLSTQPPAVCAWTPPSPTDEASHDGATTIYSSRHSSFSPATQFTGAPTASGSLRSSPQWEGEIRRDHQVACANPDRNCDYCPSRKTPHTHIPPYHMPPAPSPPIHVCPPGPPQHMVMSPPPLAHPPMEYTYYGIAAPWTFDKNGPPSHFAPMAMASPPMSYAPPMAFVQPWSMEEVSRVPMSGYQVPPGAVECFPNGVPIVPFQMPPSPPHTDRRHSTPSHTTPSPPLADSFGRMTLQSGEVQVYNADVASKNHLVVSRIESGQDTRTTVMIKNIPNKMSDKDLIAYINKVCPRRIDFLYLRMDFQNGCNVGYAFVNFIEAQDLLKFAKTRLGEKWNMFSSEKVLQMSYANYQGKEALVEKFKNSCIMDERESWRPKIFYSFGPNQGLLEPFPAPTHIRRKERSSFNRGALYVPSLHTRNTLNSPLVRGDGHYGSMGHRSGPRRGNRSGAAA